MKYELVERLRSNPLLSQYLKYNSYWYKELIRNPSSIKNLEQEMKKEYKLTTEDKITKLSERMNMLSSFLDVLK